MNRDFVGRTHKKQKVNLTKRLPERQPLWFLPFFCEQGSAICPGKVTVFERVHSRAQLFGQPLGKIGTVAQTAGQDDLRQKPLAFSAFWP